MININNTPWEKLTSADILALLDNDNGESFFFEFKEDGVRNEQLHKEISAFANTYGGYIFLGITDKKDITGCVKWTEERIHNVIYNNITPTPDFDVQQFHIDGNTVFIIKIEEGSMPPYITSDGKIFERVSSSSMPIKDSAKLSQLYSKHNDHLRKLTQKITNEALPAESMPNNLCAYIDLGFGLRCKDKKVMVDTLFDCDYTNIADYLRKECKVFSISQVGHTRVFTIGEMSNNDDGSIVILPSAAMHNYIVLMSDGSAKYRICLFANEEGKVDLGPLLLTELRFRKIYTMVFGEKIAQEFIYARKYAQLTVLKQFTTFFDASVEELVGVRLEDHIKKYGNNIIVCGNRYPYNDYALIDKRMLTDKSKEYSARSIIGSLFYNPYSFMGLIDFPKKSE